MARAIWTGSISFGLVNIPVGLYSAVSEKSIRFNQIERGTSDRIRYKRVNEATGKEVEFRDIVKGYDVGDGRYVVLSEKELESVEPAGGRTIEIEDFVDQADIDPIYYSSTYYLGPKTEAATKPYRLLVEAMGASGKAAVARFVMRGKEHLGVVRVDKGVLILETMHFADEIRDPLNEIEIAPSAEPASERELQAAVTLVESMSVKWDPTNYEDNYRARVEALIEQHLSGDEAPAPRPERPAKVVDLLEALQRSVDAARSGRKAGGEVVRRRSAQEQPAETSAKRHGRTKQPQGEQLSMMTRDELYQLAQDIQLPGRSKMTRNELERAVTEAQAARRAS